MVRIKTLVTKTLGYTEHRHEELYAEIEDMVIRSDELPNSQKGMSRIFGDVTVVLCTLATLSNPKLGDCGLFRVIPVRSLVIDEASQIDVFEFMVMIPVLVFIDK
jgi:regulator of nonsense transcripts 1